MGMPLIGMVGLIAAGPFVERGTGSHFFTTECVDLLL
jgi:hypothetical protein